MPSVVFSSRSPSEQSQSPAAGDTESPPASFYRALYDFQAQLDTELSFCQGDIIEVLTKDTSGWWDGIFFYAHGAQRRGWFPSNFLVPVPDHEAAELLAANASPTSSPTTSESGSINFSHDITATSSQPSRRPGN